MAKTLEGMSNEELWQLFPILLKPHSTEYARIFEEEKNRITNAMDRGGIFRFTHIGSTSVPGLIAKPTVDMLLEIQLEYPLESLIKQLTPLGYLFVPQPDNPPPHAVFYYGYTPQGFAKRVIHLHVRYPGDWNELYFGEYLRNHPDEAKRYGELKQQLKARFEHNRDAYTNAKSTFVLTRTAAARKEMPGRFLPNSPALNYWQKIEPEKQFTTFFEPKWVSDFLTPETWILDVGCGYGRTLEELSNAGFPNLAGTDISGSLLERARTILPPGTTLKVQTPGKLDFPDNSFDAVLLLAVLTCIPEESERSLLVSEISRVLRPGGILVVTDFLINDDARNQARYRDCETGHPFGTFQLPDGPLLRHSAQNDLRILFSSWETEKEETCIFPTMNGHTSRGWKLLAKKSAAKSEK